MENNFSRQEILIEASEDFADEAVVMPRVSGTVSPNINQIGKRYD